MIQVRKFTDIICNALRPFECKVQRQTVREGDCDSHFERVRDKHGRTNRDTTAEQRERGRTKGAAVTNTCFMCRQYLKQDGKTRCYENTCWKCSKCMMPLCKVSRLGKHGGRTMDCLTEHLSTEIDFFKCCNERGEKNRTYDNVPNELSVNLWPQTRTSNRSAGRR
jgi:hypothetical protein